MSPLPSPTSTSPFTRPTHISRNSSGSNSKIRAGLGIASSDAKVRSGSHPPSSNTGSKLDIAPSTSNRLGVTSAPPTKNRFSDGLSNPSLDEFAVQRWVLSVGCVNFDLEKGPDLEFLYPSLGISREERDNIAFSSFPDTSIFDDGHAVFSWRVREVPLDSSNSEAPIIGTPLPTLPELPENLSGHLPVPHRQDSTASTPSNASVDHQAALEHAQNILRVASPGAQNTEQDGAIVSPNNGQKRSASTSGNYIHGYCFFRQKRDATIRRGYFQKSVVILSHLPYVSFFSELVRRLGPLFFETGMPILEAFCHDVQNWEPPEPGAKLHLPFLGSVISVELPYYSFSQSTPLPDAQRALTQRTDGSREDAPILASIPSTSLFEVFQELIGDLWLMWECLLLAEPMLVVAPDPTACSEAVWHMLDLIKPIPYAGDFRPFFTIHDFDFRTLVTKNKPAAGTIIGVTNPFMLQACKHWPHVLKVGRTGGNSAGGGGPEHTPGLISKRKRRISKDRALIKQLVEAAEGKGCSAEVANELLRKYFTDLTERFLAPLNRYVSSLIPAEFDLSSPYETPKIRPFNTTAFLSSLKTHGTPLQLKSKNLPTGPAVRQSLYVDFLQCPNFSLWLHMRIRQSQEEQYMRKLRALESGNVASFANARGEMESVELYARLQVEIKGINDRLLAGRKERELEPNSRWKCSPNMSGRWQKSFTHGERTLLTHKAGLIDQVQRLLTTLPEDLRQSLRLKEQQRQREGVRF
ncbi:DUF1630-domain-containing protein [Meira miltonrushii]|uniref:DUF1630-domain-containing protein n=1 Tax=Meira miltonrushii TaxID=1280837 RepID=A0A316VH95_9BASI|nr:DUF1630-domain-containing protein [Meira miltonrushii]PWN35703.1 DUF1630-domain-containing protein [Meira miltonrushii]